MEFSEKRLGAWSVRIPFLSSVDYVVFAIGALCCGGGDVRDIATSFWLGDSDTGALVPGEKLGKELLLQSLATKLVDRGDSESKASVQ